MAGLRTTVLTAAAGVGVFSLVMGAAASVLVDTDDLGAGTIDVSSCDADGVDIQYVTSPVASDDPDVTDGSEGTTTAAPDTDSLDPASASVGTPTFFVTAVQVSGISPLCEDQRLEITLYCDDDLEHMVDVSDPVNPTSQAATRNCVTDGDERFEFLSSNNTADGPRGTPVGITHGAAADGDGNLSQQFDVFDVEAALVDQASVLMTGDENEPLAPSQQDAAVDGLDAWTMGETIYMKQAFTAGITGQLTAIELYRSAAPSDSGVMTLSVLDSGNNVLMSQGGVTIPDIGVWTRIELDTPVVSVAGAGYTFLLDGGGDGLQLSHDSAGNYTEFQQPGQGPFSWTDPSLSFRTYVRP